MKQKNDFIIRGLSFLAIVVMLLVYNHVLGGWQAADAKAEAAAAKAAEQSSGSSEGSEETSGYKDGTYTGSAEGYGGTIQVQVTIQNGKITKVEALSHSGEDASYYNMAATLLDTIVQEQTTAVDTVSGATFSSVGILNAASEALNQAIGD